MLSAGGGGGEVTTIGLDGELAGDVASAASPFAGLGGTSAGGGLASTEASGLTFPLAGGAMFSLVGIAMAITPASIAGRAGGGRPALIPETVVEGGKPGPDHKSR
jgi:hypothetical protein